MYIGLLHPIVTVACPLFLIKLQLWLVVANYSVKVWLLNWVRTGQFYEHY